MKSKNIVIIAVLIASLTGAVLAVALLFFNFRSMPERSTPIEIGKCFAPSLIVYGTVVILNILLILLVKLWKVESIGVFDSVKHQCFRFSRILGWINSLNAFPFGLLAAICINLQGSGAVPNAPRSGGRSS